jgi:hypothetical protein
VFTRVSSHGILKGRRKTSGYNFVIIMVAASFMREADLQVACNFLVSHNLWSSLHCSSAALSERIGVRLG